MEQDIISLLSAGSDGGIILLLGIALKQMQTINALNARLIKLETIIENEIYVRNDKQSKTRTR